MDALITEAKNGDKEAFVRLIRMNKQSLYKTAWIYLRDEQDIADALQNTILSCYENIQRLREPKYFKTWLMRILINECKDILCQNPLLVYWCIRQNPYPLIFHCLKRSALTAFFTRSSAANIPVNMKVCEEMGLDRDTYSVTIPLGATINMDGAAITITVMTMATAFTLGIHVDIPTAIILSLLAALSACGASGVAGGSLLLIPMACSLFGISDDISMQVVAVGFIIGVIQDSVETALNSSSDLLLSASAEFRQWRREGKEIKF